LYGLKIDFKDKKERKKKEITREDGRKEKYNGKSQREK
jgi:hypothetical protein